MIKKWVPLWAVVILVAFAIGTVWLRLTIVRMAYAINEVERQIEKLHREREILQVKLVALRSPKRLETLARTKYGLNPPKMEKVVHFRMPQGREISKER
jgi:cell division protein FtsL